MEGIEKDFVDMYRDVGAGMGAPDLFLTIFARLYIEPEEMAMDELAKETGYSLASISNTLKMLEPLDMVKKTKKPGSKKIYLYTEKDMAKIMSEHLLRKEEHGIKILKEKIPELLEKYKGKNLSAEEKKKILIVQGYHEALKKMQVILIETIEKFKQISK